MDAMAGYLLDVRSVRREVDRREACGQWVAGSSGEGGAFAMRTPEEKARRVAAGSDNEVRPLPCAYIIQPCARGREVHPENICGDGALRHAYAPGEGAGRPLAEMTRCALSPSAVRCGPIQFGAATAGECICKRCRLFV